MQDGVAWLRSEPRPHDNARPASRCAHKSSEVTTRSISYSYRGARGGTKDPDADDLALLERILKTTSLHRLPILKMLFRDGAWGDVLDAVITQAPRTSIISILIETFSASLLFDTQSWSRRWCGARQCF